MLINILIAIICSQPDLQALKPDLPNTKPAIFQVLELALVLYVPMQSAVHGSLSSWISGCRVTMP